MVLSLKDLITFIMTVGYYIWEKMNTYSAKKGRLV